MFPKHTIYWIRRRREFVSILVSNFAMFRCESDEDEDDDDSDDEGENALQMDVDQ